MKKASAVLFRTLAVSFLVIVSDTSSPPLLMFERGLVPCKNALLQAAAHGTSPEVAMLLSLSFALGDEEESDEEYIDEGDFRTFDRSVVRKAGCW